MAKIKTSFSCQNCGVESPKWTGKCPSCGEWNTFVEEVVQKEETQRGGWKASSNSSKKANQPKPLKEITFEEQSRLITGDVELDRVLGGGIVPGSLVLIGGEPGIGKSTLMLQIALMLSNTKVLYVSGEESETQIKMRSERMKHHSDECFVLSGHRFHPNPPQPICRVSCRIGQSGEGMYCRTNEVCQRNRNTCFPNWPYHQRWNHRRTENLGTYGGYSFAV